MSEKKLIIFLNFLKFLIPFLALFFGFFIWLEGYKFLFKDNMSRINALECSYLGFWFITLCFLFKKFFSINSHSKLLSIFFAFAISIEFWVLLYYNNFSDGCFFMIRTYTMLDIFIIALATIFPALEALIIGVSMVSSSFQPKLAYLTNYTKIRNGNISKTAKFFEIWISFPVFIGIYHFFLLLHEFFILKWCYYLQTYIMVLIALPWIILMTFYVIYTSVMILKDYK